MTRIITEGFLDYPFHIMLKPYLYQPERYPQCLEAVNRMLVRAYLRCRNALVVEHEGRVVAVALMHDRKVGFWDNFINGGHELFRYATPLLVLQFDEVAARSDQVAIAARGWGVGSLPKCCRTLWQRGAVARMASSHRRNPTRASIPTEAASSSISSRFA